MFWTNLEKSFEWNQVEFVRELFNLTNAQNKCTHAPHCHFIVVNALRTDWMNFSERGEHWPCCIQQLEHRIRRNALCTRLHFYTTHGKYIGCTAEDVLLAPSPVVIQLRFWCKAGVKTNSWVWISLPRAVPQHTGATSMFTKMFRNEYILDELDVVPTTA